MTTIISLYHESLIMTHIYSTNMKKQKHKFYSIYSGDGTEEHEKETILGYWLGLYFFNGGTFGMVRKLERVPI